MKSEIIQNLKNPEQLEKLYRANSALFKKEFNALWSEYPEETSLQVWNQRLNYAPEPITLGAKNELLFILILGICAALISQIPSFFGLDQDTFFQRNISFVIFPFLSAYSIWKQQVPVHKILLPLGICLFSVIYINLLPHTSPSDSILLACIHVPLILWSVWAYSYLGERLLSNTHKRIEFLRLHGDLLVMCAIILLSGGLFTAISLGLFEIIGLDIKEFYGKYVIVSGLSATPILGNYLIQKNPALVKNVSPIIAKIFTPVVFVFLFVYLIAMAFTGKDPYTNREFLLIFNGLLIGVMALILFSVAEAEKNESPKYQTWLLLGLSALTIVVNGVALSAICFRIIEWGITPNRIAVLGSNLLIFIHLVLVANSLLKTTQGKSDFNLVAKSIAQYLPIYSIWAAIVCFIFPLIFQFR
ncbi:DUF4153 domain-containing protein [Cytophagaceae bacterium 50C-KIRBA]|uniref:DUF4153 domain-containing protein n=1 Tax=Aquirufa beregesia TaxID=2516556 RepID=A0ABX0EWJ3_9BACT|nr:DUF4153 domain-containing protein [Aquirufa beregesia]NGZ43637.1 DUF4153 domain-containing protein [Aquirufa beregesia]